MSVPTSPLVISFVGSSGVGKTGLIEALIPLLRAEGLRVGSVKHAPHGFDVDKPHSDSSRHRAAGAELVLLAGRGSGVLFVGSPDRDEGEGRHHMPGPEHDVGLIGELLRDPMGSVDVVLVEGFAAVSDRVVQLTRRGVADKPNASAEPPWLRVTDVADGSPYSFTFDEVAALAQRMVVEHAALVSTGDT